MENLTATFLLRDVKVGARTDITGFTLEPIPGHPNDTYLRFDFIPDPEKDPYSESEKEIQPLSFVLSVLYRIGCPEPEDIVDKSGVRSQVIAPSIKRNPAELEQTDFDKIKKVYKKVKSMTDKDKEIFDFVANWVQKASDSHNVYDKFISYWIAFNSLYGPMRSKRNSERHAIEKWVEWIERKCNNTCASEFFAGFQQSKRDSSEYKAIKDLADANLKLREKPKNKNVSKKLNQKIKDRKFDLEALRYLVLCLYAVRNNLFHGDWSYLGEATVGHVGGAEFLLYRLIRRGLEKQCNLAF